jgi:hypothetical protein
VIAESKVFQQGCKYAAMPKSNAEQNPLDIYLRFAALERRVTKLESNPQEIDRIVDP